MDEISGSSARTIIIILINKSDEMNDWRWGKEWSSWFLLIETLSSKCGENECIRVGKYGAHGGRDGGIIVINWSLSDAINDSGNGMVELVDLSGGIITLSSKSGRR